MAKERTAEPSKRPPQPASSQVPPSHAVQPEPAPPAPPPASPSPSGYAPAQYPPGRYPPPAAYYGAGGFYGQGSSGDAGAKGPPVAAPPAGASSAARVYLNKYQDLWAAVLFLLNFFALQGIAIFLGVRGFQQSAANSASASSSGTEYAIGDWLPQLGVAVAVGLVFAWLWLQLIKLAPVAMIYISLWWGVLMAAALGTFMLVVSSTTRFMGLLFLLLAVLQALYAISVRSRIPFAGAMLKKAVQAIRRFPSTVWVSYLALLVSVEWVLVWAIGAAGAVGQTSSWLIIFLMLLSFFWTMEVIRNVVHVTTAGTVATYYFQRQNMPPNPVARALGRAVSKSFGSICLGSFIVAFLQAARTVVASFRAQNRDSAVAAILASCAECLLACIESLVRYFNKWAYVQVAVYGKPFVQAARDTWDLFQQQGFTMVINDDLTQAVLFMGCLIGGIVSALIAGIWTYRTNQDIAVGVAMLAFFIGYFMTYLTMSVIESAVASYYVCYAEDPATLQRNDPEFYEIIRERQTFLMM